MDCISHEKEAKYCLECVESFRDEVERLKAENKFLTGTLEEFRLGVAKDVAKNALKGGE